MEQQTAVEWLLLNLEVPFPKINEYKLIIELAKQMEKEQIEGAYIKGGVFQFDKDKEAEQYYNETYGK